MTSVPLSHFLFVADRIFTLCAKKIVCALLRETTYSVGESNFEISHCFGIGHYSDVDWIPYFQPSCGGIAKRCTPMIPSPTHKPTEPSSELEHRVGRGSVPGTGGLPKREDGLEHFYPVFAATIHGSFSAVSKPNFARGQAPRIS